MIGHLSLFLEFPSNYMQGLGFQVTCECSERHADLEIVSQLSPILARTLKVDWISIDFLAVLCVEREGRE